MPRPKKSVQEKVQKKYPEFVSAVDGLSVADLESKLAMYAKESENVDQAQENDEEIEKTNALLSELKGPYLDARKAIKLKMRYVISLIKEKGGDA